MSELKRGYLAVINCKSPANVGRLIVLHEYMGLVECGVEFGQQEMWKVKPVSNQKLVTAVRYTKFNRTGTYYIPESWMAVVSVEDYELDMFLLLWAEDERTLRREG